jgi:acyl-CoA thioester hydrolase
MEMHPYERKIDLRWADLDPNFHVRHSVYYDYGAYIRIDYLQQNGLTNEVFIRHHFGPIVFREECVFKKELKIGDQVTINLELSNARQDFSRWTIVHHIKKDDQLAALITLDGAWIDTHLRKLTTLPLEYRQVFENMPRSQNFQWNVK